MGYPVGTELTLENALKIMLVKSANDIAVAIAEAVGGTEDRFITMMNEKATEIGMTDSHFVNPNGLPQEGQYTTARDFGLLAARVRRDYPEYAGVFSIEALQLPGRKSAVPNTNILLGRMAGADGMKTGYICASGFNLVASATRGGRTIVAVVLGALDPQVRADQAADLLAAGFATDPASVSETVKSLPRYGEDGAEVADISRDICTGSAQLDRYDGRDVDGKYLYRSASIEPMRREPIAVSVALGGADGPPARNTGLVDIPLPQPRPETLRDLAMETPAVGRSGGETSQAPDPVDDDEHASAEPSAGDTGDEDEIAAGTAPADVVAIPLPQERPDQTQ